MHVPSAALGVTKNVVVYLPGGYDAAPAKRWPVYYFLHGLGGDETSWTAGGHLDEVADRLGVQAIIVMPDADNSFYTDAVTPIDYDACLKTGAGMLIPTQPRKQTCVRTAAYEAWITKDLIAWVDTTYRTLATRDARGIAGFSMGGYGALVLALRHKDLFVAAASHSGVDALLYSGPWPYVAGKAQLETDVQSWGGRDPFGTWMRALMGPDLANWRAHDPAFLVGELAAGELALYIDCGTEDVLNLHNEAKYLHDLLVAKRIEHTYYVGPGRHDFSFWTPRLPESLGFLRAHVAVAR
jgi:S-formylglutathione hydrolase FrmB